MARRDLVVVGASAGGVEALRALVAGLPPEFSASLLVVLHVPAYGGSVLPNILARCSRLTAAHAMHGEALVPGRIFVAPPDRHLLVQDNQVLVTTGPKENGHRPAVDPTMRSAARWRGPRAVGVVLSGALDDGSAGLAAIVESGGVAVVQDPEDAMYPGMPSNAIAHVGVSYILPVNEIAPLLVRLLQDEVADGPVRALPSLGREVAVAEMDPAELDRVERPGEPSGITCPECHGALFELHEGDLVRYRCRVGHAYAVESLFAGQSEALEAAMWTALRTLEDKVALNRRMAEHARARGQELIAARYDASAAEVLDAAKRIRSLLDHVEQRLTRLEPRRQG